MDDEDRPRPRGDSADALASESLDAYSRDELAARIEKLEAEIDRVKAHRDRKQAHMSAADALFGKPK
jgi:uncharacterized small protein (DUF1192 family)